MATLSYSFCMSLLHSFWQAALLYAVYFLADKSLGTRFTPVQKRNLLYVSLLVQSALFVFTFCLYYIKPVAGLSTLIDVTGLATIITPESVSKISPWFFTAYTVIVFYKFTKAVYNWFWFKKEFKLGLVKPPVDLKLFATSHQFQFGIKRKVQLWLSSTIDSPITFGFFKPVIVLPVALINQLSLQQAETLILHELAHIKANDFLLNWFVIVAETIFFFNPFIISICKKIKLEREKSCDITVTAFHYQPLLYAEALLMAQSHKQQFAKQLLQTNAVAAINKPQHLLNRIQFFVNPVNQLQPGRKKVFLPVTSLVITAAIMVCLLFQIQVNNTAMPATPLLLPAETAFMSSENQFPPIVNNILSNLSEKNLQKISAEVEKHQPEIEKKIKELEPLLKEIQAKAEKLSEATETNFVTPASMQENNAVKQIVIKEEQSGSKNATVKVYNVIYKNGKWLLQPQWKLAAKEITPADSLKLIDTTNPLQEYDAAEEQQD